MKTLLKSPYVFFCCDHTHFREIRMACETRVRYIYTIRVVNILHTLAEYFVMHFHLVLVVVVLVYYLVCKVSAILYS